jgi:hypothetical protein
MFPLTHPPIFGITQAARLTMYKFVNTSHSNFVVLYKAHFLSVLHVPRVYAASDALAFSMLAPTKQNQVTHLRLENMLVVVVKVLRP